jgi:PAS domain S-box-containing protein
LTRAVPARDDAGHIIGWYGTTTDIHDRKQAEDALRHQAEIIDHTHDAVIATDLAGVVTSWNKGAERLFGYTAAEMVGHSVLQLFPEELQAQFPTQVMAPLRERGQHELETRQNRKSGEECYIHLSLSLRCDPQGSPIGIVGYGIDITARKQAEKKQERLLTEVQQVNAELQQFAYIVSHDLNEPLRTIVSFLQMLTLRLQGSLTAEVQEYVAFAVDGARRMQQMIADLLAYSRAGGQDLTFAPVECEALLARILNDLQIAIKESGGTITHDRLPTVTGDVTHLGQVLQNLIGNALKFRREVPPRVHISARHEGQHWQFSIHDNGIGIDPTCTNRIFQVFHRLHTRDKYQGTGIGLAICKKIIERHGGRIWVESMPGHGSTFYFTLPE